MGLILGFRIVPNSPIIPNPNSVANIMEIGASFILREATIAVKHIMIKFCIIKECS